MTSHTFELALNQLEELLIKYPNKGKNSHVGNLAVEVVELYFLSLDPQAEINIGTNGADLEVTSNGKTDYFEIKGTVDKNISWQKLKVSSKACYDALVNGMTLIRVTNIGETKMELHFMKYGEDFSLVPEDRWAIKKIKGKGK